MNSLLLSMTFSDFFMCLILADKFRKYLIGKTPF